MKVAISKYLIHTRLFFLCAIVLVCSMMLFYEPYYTAQLAWMLQMPIQEVEIGLVVVGLVALFFAIPNLLYYLEGDNCEERYQKECESFEE